MTNLTFKIYDEIFIDPEEFFNKTKNIKLNLERLAYDNEPVKLKQEMNGFEFRGLLLGIKEEIEAGKEYIFISKIKDGIMIRHEVYDKFEEELINEWMVRM